MKSFPLIQTIDFYLQIQQLLIVPDRKPTWLNPHCPFISDKIWWPLHISWPQRDGTLMCDGEWFFSLPHCYVSRTTWNHAPLPFYHAMSKGGAIETAYRLTSRPCLIIAMRFHCPITVGSVRPRSNGPWSLCSHPFQYHPSSHLHCLFSRSNGLSFFPSRIVHSPCSPHPLNIPSTWRTKVPGLPVPVAISPQQPHLINSMAEEKRTEHEHVTAFRSYGTSLIWTLHLPERILEHLKRSDSSTEINNALRDSIRKLNAVGGQLWLLHT